MKSAALLLALAVPNFCHASTVYYMIMTGMAGANTTIDSAHEMEWVAPSLSPACLVTTCTSFTIAAFNPTFDWYLGGGTFEIKVGNSPTDDITLQLWEGDSTGTPMASAKVLSSNVRTSYTPTPFLFDEPVPMQAGHHYFARLTSLTGTSGNRQYFIKGVDALSIQDNPNGGGNNLPESIPEPATWLLGSSAMGLLALVRQRRTD